MDRIVGKTRTPLPAAAFEALWAAYPRCLIDIGTGDGAYVLRAARAAPDMLCIGLDPAVDQMVETSRKAAAKPKKGGVPNALFVAGAVEALPPELTGRASEITSNYPWGSLLRALAVADGAVLAGIAALARPDGAALSVLINHATFRDPDLRARLDLPEVPLERARAELVPAYAAAGLILEDVQMLEGELPERTSWGRRLVMGSGRATLVLQGRVAAKGAERDDHSAG